MSYFYNHPDGTLSLMSDEDIEIEEEFRIQDSVSAMLRPPQRQRLRDLLREPVPTGVRGNSIRPSAMGRGRGQAVLREAGNQQV